MNDLKKIFYGLFWLIPFVFFKSDTFISCHIFLLATTHSIDLLHWSMRRIRILVVFSNFSNLFWRSNYLVRLLLGGSMVKACAVYSLLRVVAVLAHVRVWDVEKTLVFCQLLNKILGLWLEQVLGVRQTVTHTCLLVRHVPLTIIKITIILRFLFLNWVIFDWLCTAVILCLIMHTLSLILYFH